MAASAVVTAYVLLGRSPMWNPWLHPALVGAGVLALATIVVLGARLSRRGVSAAGALATIVTLIGPAAYSIQTMATSHAGAIVSAGPVTASGRFGAAPPVGSDAAARGGNPPAFGGNGGSSIPAGGDAARLPEGGGR